MPRTWTHERLEILPYRSAWRRHFERLNRAWLEALFQVEPADARILADPYGQIVRPGGEVFFARLDGEVVGTCALVRHPRAIYELAKMAVAEDQRRRGIGGRLAAAALEAARRRRARMVFLETSPRLIAARRWYERLGFERTDRHPLGSPRYQRRSIVLQMILSAKGEAPTPLPVLRPPSRRREPARAALQASSAILSGRRTP